MVDVTEVSLRTQIFGTDFDLPIGVSPTAMSELKFEDGRIKTRNSGLNIVPPTLFELSSEALPRRWRSWMCSC